MDATWNQNPCQGAPYLQMALMGAGKIAEMSAKHRAHPACMWGSLQRPRPAQIQIGVLTVHSNYVDIRKECGMLGLAASARRRPAGEYSFWFRSGRPTRVERTMNILTSDSQQGWSHRIHCIPVYQCRAGIHLDSVNAPHRSSRSRIFSHTQHAEEPGSRWVCKTTLTAIAGCHVQNTVNC